MEILSNSSPNLKPYIKRINQQIREDESLLTSNTSKVNMSETPTIEYKIHCGHNPTPLESDMPQYIIFERIHLSPTDENVIDMFLRSLHVSNNNYSEENNFFEIICTDFGAEIFLQYSAVFKV